MRFVFLDMDKKCNGCLEIKNVSEFGKESRAKNGYKPRCKKCLNKYYRDFYKYGYYKTKQKYGKKRYLQNREKCIELTMNYYNLNKKKIIQRNKLYIRKRKLQYPHLKTLSSFRTLVKKMINNTATHTFVYLEYSFADLIKSLGGIPDKTQNIDHKIPISWFIKGTEMKIIFALDNLQILDSKENRIKGNRYCHEISKKYYEQIKDLIKPEFKNKLKNGN